MRSKILIPAVALFSLSLAGPAFADESGARQRPSFPMPAATFQAHVQAKQAKIREHAEKRFAKLPAEQAKEARAKLDAKIAAMNAEVQKAVADGTVTKEEAKAVRAAGGGHGKGHCGGGEKKK